MRQTTIRSAQQIAGIGLHSGEEVTARLLPAAAGSGIVFRRRDKDREIRADCRAVGDTYLATVLQQDDVQVGMVEHLLSSLAACDIDNIIIELSGKEVPALDGSAAPWLLLLDSCGRQQQDAPRRRIRIEQPVRVTAEDGGFAEFTPAAGSSYHITIDYAHEVVNRSGRSYDFALTRAGYASEIAAARTFCYVDDVEKMHRSARALGGSLQNAVVYGDDGVINPGGLRYDNEFVRHKMLDAIGDCYINGHQVLGRYRAGKPGHGINNRLMRALMENTAAWRWTEEDDDNAAAGA